MSDTSNKRIAKNTGFLYIRMLLIMLVTLYTSRVVLAELGIDDYGVYMVVGGVVSMFGFLNNCMTSSTQRYLNYELGRKDDDGTKIKQVFSTALLIHAIIAVIVLIAAETIGLWFVNNKLTIPPESMSGANIVYQASILAFCVSIMKVPFNASIIAHEKMQLYAIVSVLEAILKLAIAFALILSSSHKLALYGILVFLVQFAISLTYIIIALKRFDECSLRFRYEKGLFKEMFSFAGWNMFGSLAWLVRGQGMGIVLNIFFGPALNAAKGVADQVSGAVSTLNSNFQIALNPQITKNYAAGDISDMEKLTYRGLKFSSFLLWMLALPIIICSNQILGIWLEDIPPYSSLFVILIMFDAISGNMFGTPLMTALSATGNIRTYQITVSAVLLLILPAAYFALKAGFPPEVIFYLNILFNFLSGIVRYWFCKKQIGYHSKLFLHHVFLPVIMIMAISAIVPVIFKYYIIHLNDILTLIILGTISLLSSFVTIWYFGLDRNERTAISGMLLSRIKRK